MDNEFDRAVEESRAFLESRPVPDLTARVMRRIEALDPAPAHASGSLLQRLLALLWAPRQISVRPVFALSGAAAIVCMIAFSALTPRRPGPQVTTTPPLNPKLFVQFRLDADASRVLLAGSFTQWQPRYELHQSAPGLWTITVPLTQGVHDYAFVVDGQQWVPDPYAPQISDGFGGMNSRLALLPPEAPQL